MLVKTRVPETKNPMWQHYTPNELYESDILSHGLLGCSYSTFIEAWKGLHQVPGKNVWFEVRIVSGKTSEAISDRRAWWRQSEFMDKIFWVFQHPLPAVLNGKRYFTYMLEPLEARRVVEIAKDKLGYNPFEGEAPLLFIPTECCVLAWTETSNGYSDHGRHRPEESLSAEEEDKRAQGEMESDRLLGEVIDIGEDFDKIMGELDSN